MATSYIILLPSYIIQPALFQILDLTSSIIHITSSIVFFLLPSYIFHRIVPTSSEPQPLLKNRMNKERFHNALALNLGYDRIVNDKRISIKIDDTTTDPVVTLTSAVSQHSVSFNASEDADSVWVKIQETQSALAPEQEVKEIIDAVHQAYNEANKNQFD